MTMIRHSLVFALIAGVVIFTAPNAYAQEAEEPEVVSTGTGHYSVTYETMPGLPSHVVYYPENLATVGEGELGLYLFGNGACSADGTSSKHHLIEIASHGFIAIAPGTIPGSEEANGEEGDREGGLRASTPAEALNEALDWAFAENEREGSPLFGRLATDQVAASGFSCGGLQALVTAPDSRIKTSVLMYTGIFNHGNPIAGIAIDKSQLDRLHSSVIYILGGPTDIAYENGMDDYARINSLPVAAVNIPVGHGGTFHEENGGLAAAVTMDWLNWQLRGDEDAGKMFRGSDCTYCGDSRLTIEHKNID